MFLDNSSSSDTINLECVCFQIKVMVLSNSLLYVAVSSECVCVFLATFPVALLYDNIKNKWIFFLLNYHFNNSHAHMLMEIIHSGLMLSVCVNIGWLYFKQICEQIPCVEPQQSDPTFYMRTSYCGLQIKYQRFHYSLVFDP